MVIKDELRRRAEQIFREKASQSPEDLEAMSPEATQQTLHELTVHQIELEMQNEELRRTQAELEDARARYFDLYDLAPVGYVTISEQGLITEANLTAGTLLGVTRGTLLKQAISRFILKEDQDIYYLLRKQVIENGKPQACDLRMVKKDGTVFWGHLTATAVQDADGAPVYRVVVKDITERKQSEEALRTSEEFYRGLFEHMVEGYAYCRMIFENDEPIDFNYLAVNHAFESLTGLENVAGKKVSEVIPGIRESDPQLFAIYARVSQTGKPESFEMFIEALKMWFSISVYSPGKGYFIAMFDVITERKRTEEALRESEAKYRLLINNASESILVVQDGFLKYVNPAMLGLLGGYSEQELIGKPLEEIIYPDERSLVVGNYRRRIANEAIQARYTFRVVTRDGNFKWVYINVALIEWQGKPATELPNRHHRSQASGGCSARERKAVSDVGRKHERHHLVDGYESAHDLHQPVRDQTSVLLWTR